MKSLTQKNCLLAPYACDPAKSRGRLIGESQSRTRDVFQRDRDRIVHAEAFRKLMYKTQVFLYHQGDTFRTRLTHSLEVAQITRSICRTLRLNEDLGEALALAHDLGHTAFGHGGEDALTACLERLDLPPFNHNTQTLRVLTNLEKRYPDFDGLNLSWETLEGIVKHNGPIDNPPEFISDFNRKFDLQLNSFASLEAQVAALSDDIAYQNHDIDDGLRSGLLQVEDLQGVPIVGDVFMQVAQEFLGLDPDRVRLESVRRLIGLWVNDLVETTQYQIEQLSPNSPEDVRQAERPLVAFSPHVNEANRRLKQVLFRKLYRHETVKVTLSNVKTIMSDLFGYFMDNPTELLSKQRSGLDLSERYDLSLEERGLLVSDFLASMTDKAALELHAALFSTSTQTVS